MKNKKFTQNIVIFCLGIVFNNYVCYACIGAWVNTFPLTEPLPPYSTALSRNRLLAAPNHDNRQRLKSVEQCANLAIYRASEIRTLASIYNFANNAPAQAVEDGGYLSCSFDTTDEKCAWYSITLENFNNFENFNEVNEVTAMQNGIGFRRARFESLFNLERFDCTSERSFTFDNFFLLVGGQDSGPLEFSSAIEAQIPCQSDKGVLKFDFWSNNETPILKICVLLEADLNPHCEETKMDTNPLTFEIPQSLEPFRIQILVENIGRDDIVLIDNLYYQGFICKKGVKISSLNIEEIERTTLPSSLGFITAELETLPITVSPPVLIHFSTKRPTKKYETDGFTSIHLTHRLPFSRNKLKSQWSAKNTPIEENTEQSIVKNEEKLARIELTTQSQKNEETAYLKNENFVKALRRQEQRLSESFDEKFAACQALTCNFNYDDACFYHLEGLGATALWKISSYAVGNPHTGIHRSNPNDPKLSGFAYAAQTENNLLNEVFVMESERFQLQKPAYLLFDLFHRSVGPELKVCLDGYDYCPYSSPSLQSSRHWHLNQRVLLNSTNEKVYFIAGQLRQNHYLAVDNIRLQSADGKEQCN